MNVEVIDMTEEFIYDISVEILKALSFLHEGLRMVHWDIKPENIMLKDSFEVQLVDFGLSKLIENNVMSIDGDEDENDNSASTGMIGTLTYMAPEIV